MKAILVISVDCTPEQIPDILKHIDPPTLPHFGGEVRIAIEDAAQHVLDWLDG